MIRWLAFSFGAGVAIAAASASLAGETFPVVHNEPITIRLLSGKDGAPLAHVHLNLLAGYDEQEIQRQVWHEETLTDDHGRAWLTTQLANLPFLQVWPAKMRSCQTNPRASRFSIERIRRDGLSTPNLCGAVLIKDAPGVFIVYVKDKTSGAHAVAVAGDAGKSEK